MGQAQGDAASPVNEPVVPGLDERALDHVVGDVAQRAGAWARTTPRERADLLAEVVRATYAVAEEWNAASCAAKGYDPAQAEGGEELFSGVGTFVHLAQALRRSLVDVDRWGRPHYPGPVRHKPGSRIAVQVMPANVVDRVLYPGITAEVWMEPGVSEDEVRATQAGAYVAPIPEGVSLVLGAGNVASLGPRDVLNKLFVEGHVVVLKASPVNEYLVPFWERAMAILIDQGYLRIVRGDANVGAYLVGHQLVNDVHVTGSDATFDAIVFGVDDEGARRKSANEPLVTKPVSGELGNVSPVIIVPGRWSERELRYQAKHVATMLVNNAGFNCLTPRVLVTHAQWPQRTSFLEALEQVLSTIPTRRAYYPGAAARHAAFVTAHPQARQIGDGGGEKLPWTIVDGVDANRVDDVCFNVEAFCSLTSETALEADSPADFVRRATTFCNERIWGSLSVTLLADPRTLRERETGAAIDRAIADLRYGSIGVNLWHAMSFVYASTVWGAYPGHATSDIRSGRGFVGNALLFARPQKSVVRGPFVATPDPVWFATNAHASPVMRKLLAFEASPSWARVPGLVFGALRP